MLWLPPPVFHTVQMQNSCVSALEEASHTVRSVVPSHELLCGWGQSLQQIEFSLVAAL